MAKLLRIPTPPSKHSLADLIASLPKRERDRRLKNLTEEERKGILWDWRYQGRKEQQPPEGDWRTWLLLAGRGFGKSRTGAEYVRRQVEDRVCHRVALVAPTAADCRDVMVEGQSALGRGPT